jgi:hypothetical protein
MKEQTMVLIIFMIIRVHYFMLLMIQIVFMKMMKNINNYNDDFILNTVNDQPIRPLNESALQNTRKTPQGIQDLKDARWW